eukprot:73814-Alexandrium_andersonii.AAC.1
MVPARPAANHPGSRSGRRGLARRGSRAWQARTWPHSNPAVTPGGPAADNGASGRSDAGTMGRLR